MINVDIFTAVENSNLYLAKFLLKKGANPNQKNKSDLSLVQLAVTRTNDAVGVDMIQLLAKHGAYLSYKEPPLKYHHIREYGTHVLYLFKSRY